MAAAGHHRLRGCLKANIALEHWRGGFNARARLSDLQVLKASSKSRLIKATGMAFAELFK